MFKRTLTLSVICAILISLFGIINACATQTGYLTDNFDDKALSDYFANYSSSVFKNNNDGQQAYSIVPKDGSTTDKVLRFSSQKSDGSSTVSANTGVYTIDQSPTADTMTIFSYDIRFKSFSTSSSTSMYLVRGGGFAGMKMVQNTISNYSGSGSKATLSSDKWYKVVFMLGGNTNQNASVYVTDASTGEIVHTGDTTGTYSIGSLRAFSVLNGQISGLEFEIDNAELFMYSPAVDVPGLVSSSIKKNEDRGRGDTTTLTIVFDQILDTLSATVGGEPCTMEKVANKISTYVVTLPTLSCDTTYTVDFSGSTNSAGTSSGAAITFSTEQELRDASIENGAENVKRNAELSFEFSYEVTPTSILILKKGEDTVTCPTVLDGNTLSLNAGMLDRNSTYTVEFTNVAYVAGGSCTIPSVSFTTEDTHLWNDVAINNIAANSLDNTKTDVTFTISDNEDFSYLKFSGTVIAVRYGVEEINEGNAVRKMDKIDTIVLSDVPVGETTQTFNLGGALNAGEKLQIILIDADEKPVPLASGEIVK